MLKVYCVKDAKIGMNQPFVCNNDLDAMRQFQDTINRPPQNGIKSKRNECGITYHGTFVKNSITI